MMTDQQNKMTFFVSLKNQLTTALIFPFFFILLLAGCNEKPVKKISDEGLTAPEFLQIAPELSLPYIFSENDFKKMNNDSTWIHIPTFRSYLPDTLFNKYFDESPKTKISVLGKVSTEDKSTYLFIYRISPGKKTVTLFYFNSKAQYLGSLILLDAREKKPASVLSFKMDTRYNISRITERELPDGEVWTGEEIYYFDASGRPIMAVTNTNEDLSNEILGNPIDTLSRRNKFAGDYSTDKKNLVSIRDGRTEKSLNFFIHFSKRQGSCVGELKGEADWVNKNLAVFRDGKSPCVIEFRFTNKQVQIKETNGCGSYRDIKCAFEGSYPKVKKMHYPK
jgi:hypothetical protein